MNIPLALLLALSPQELKKETVAIPGTKVSFEMVLVPGGTFRMGSADGQPDEGPVREMEIRPFWISTRELTWPEYSLYYESYKDAKVDGITRPTQPDVVDPKEPFASGVEHNTPAHPAVSVGWYGAMGYCEWLTMKTGQRFRLPTEAEWEYAARAGAGDGAPKPVDDHGWHKGNSGGGTKETGSRKPNAWGLYDTLGNVWENCLEPYKPPASAPAVRGGAWNSDPGELRYANRQVVPDSWADRDPKRPLRLWWLTDGNFVGLRVVRPADPAPKETAAAWAAKIEVRNVKRVAAGKGPEFHDRITGEIHYTGDAALDEVEVTVLFLDEEGKPMMTDPKDKPTFNRVYPVLVHSYHDGPHRKALRKGETRAFELFVPHPFIEAGPLDLEKVVGKVTGVHLSK